MITKAECVRGRVFATRAEANLALFEAPRFKERDRSDTI